MLCVAGSKPSTKDPEGDAQLKVKHCTHLQERNSEVPWGVRDGRHRMGHRQVNETAPPAFPSQAPAAQAVGRNSPSNETSLVSGYRRDTAGWASTVMAQGFLASSTRETVTTLFKTLTHMLELMTHPASPRHQKHFLLKRSRELHLSLPKDLPGAISALAVRAANLATDPQIPLQDRLLPPIALNLYTSLLSVAPVALKLQIRDDVRAFSALEALLRPCSQQKRLTLDPRLASMICCSLTRLHKCGIWMRAVRKSHAVFLSQVRGPAVRGYDAAAVADLCVSIATFRTAAEQRPPRAWYIAISRIKELSGSRPILLGWAAKMAASMWQMQYTPPKALQDVIVHAGSHAAAAASCSDKVRPSNVAEYLMAVAHLKLALPTEAAKVCTTHSQCSAYQASCTVVNLVCFRSTRIAT
jgi:hypothetical protein